MSTPTPSGEPKDCYDCEMAKLSGRYGDGSIDSFHLKYHDVHTPAQPLPSEPKCPTCGVPGFYAGQLEKHMAFRNHYKPEEPLPSSPSEATELETLLIKAYMRGADYDTTVEEMLAEIKPQLAHHTQQRAVEIAEAAIGEDEVRWEPGDVSGMIEDDEERAIRNHLRAEQRANLKKGQSHE